MVIIYMSGKAILENNINLVLSSVLICLSNIAWMSSFYFVVIFKGRNIALHTESSCRALSFTWFVLDGPTLSILYFKLTDLSMKSAKIITRIFCRFSGVLLSFPNCSYQVLLILAHYADEWATYASKCSWYDNTFICALCLTGLQLFLVSLLHFTLSNREFAPLIRDN